MKIGEVGGLKELGLDESVLDDDWDPEKHEVRINIIKSSFLIISI